MSIADLKEYGKRCVEEPDLRKTAKEIGLEDITAHIANAKTLSLTFTEHDVRALAKEAETTQELTEEQLASVAGGIPFLAALIPLFIGIAKGGAGAAASIGVKDLVSGQGW